VPWLLYEFEYGFAQQLLPIARGKQAHAGRIDIGELVVAIDEQRLRRCLEDRAVARFARPHVGLGLLPGRHVAIDRAHGVRPAVRVAQGYLRCGVKHQAICKWCAALQVHDLRGGECLVVVLAQLVGRFPCKHLMIHSARELPGRRVDESLVLGIRVDVTALIILHAHRSRQMLEDRAQPAFAFTRGRFGLVMVADVVRRESDARHPAFGVFHRGAAHGPLLFHFRIGRRPYADSRRRARRAGLQRLLEEGFRCGSDMRQ